MKISQGSEAVIFKKDDCVVKDRVVKSYRIKEIDDKLRKFRTKREAKVLEKLHDSGFTPRLLDQGDYSLSIEFIDGPTVKEILHTNHTELSEEIGKKLAILHNLDIIHGDLTTSNMILDDEIKFIDFGLSFFSQKIEDKAVDLHLLKRALESKHHGIYEECFDTALKAYAKCAKDSKLTLIRLQQVEARGRNKH